MTGEHITVVSGLPRSGTSMLMKMLDAAGLEPIIDGIRAADSDNPGGYYELEKVKKIGEDTSWLADARGKVVKVISQLLRDLPSQFHYKVLFAHREMAEILASQRVMLGRRGQPTDTVDDVKMAALFQSHLDDIKAWMDVQPHIEAIHLHYGEIIADPQGQSRHIAAFVDAGLDAERMARVVDDNLYRQRKYL